VACRLAAVSIACACIRMKRITSRICHLGYHAVPVQCSGAENPYYLRRSHLCSSLLLQLLQLRLLALNGLPRALLLLLSALPLSLQLGFHLLWDSAPGGKGKCSFKKPRVDCAKTLGRRPDYDPDSPVLSLHRPSKSLLQPHPAMATLPTQACTLC
jgi:hypothetical protein